MTTTKEGTTKLATAEPADMLTYEGIQPKDGSHTAAVVVAFWDAVQKALRMISGGKQSN